MKLRGLMEPIAVIVDLFATRGADAYVGEPVSQLEHALQTARLAQLAAATDALIVAALLHDIGHLIHDLPEDAAKRGVDTRHQELGPAWLSRYFPRAVTDPIHLHVAAKRYLCSVNHPYRDELSEASLRSLSLQGGPMREDEVRAFEQLKGWHEGVQLRQWDDRAKAQGFAVPPLQSYLPHIQRVLKTRAER